MRLIKKLKTLIERFLKNNENHPPEMKKGRKTLQGGVI
jgi:hypothetical protein